MAFIMEQAGGMASTGFENILDIQPESIHQRAPVAMGSSEDVLEYIAICQKHAKKWDRTGLTQRSSCWDARYRLCNDGFYVKMGFKDQKCEEIWRHGVFMPR